MKPDRHRHIRAAIDAMHPLSESPLRVLKPIFNRVIIEPIHIKTMGNEITLEMPQNASDIFYSVVGRVVSVGPGFPQCRRCNAAMSVPERPPIPINPGDIVIFTGSAYSMNYEGTDYKLATDDEIVAIVEL